MIIQYQRDSAISYAKRWALSYNPQYYNFTNIGGDCTNFISQCIYAGCNVMNYERTYGWYYININNRSPSWTGVNYLYNFLVNNSLNGPFGEECELAETEPGDFIQLGSSYGEFYHSLFILEKSDDIYIATHTSNELYRPLSSYYFVKYRCIHILGARKN